MLDTILDVMSIAVVAMVGTLIGTFAVGYAIGLMFL